LCVALSRLSELQLREFLWSDAVTGFAKAESSARILSLKLDARVLSMATARIFNRAFSGLVDINFRANGVPVRRGSTKLLPAGDWKKSPLAASWIMMWLHASPSFIGPRQFAAGLNLSRYF
jgi:hypothetical protein